MYGAVSRTQFLHGDLKGRNRPSRPPWAVDEAAFLEHCTRCRACLDACPQHVIVPGSGGFPEVDLRIAECTFCAQCVSGCEPQVLSRSRHLEGLPPWDLTAEIDRSCLNHQGVFCRVCADRCIARAIRFLPVRGGAFVPRIDRDHCNGCGACVAACPVHALRAVRPVWAHDPSTPHSQHEESRA